MMEYAIWKPKYDGHAPPNWRKGMKWDCEPFFSDGPSPDSALGGPSTWYASNIYKVPAEALNNPNDDAMAKWKAADAADIARMAESLRQYPAEELAKHGITLAPEKDWATELTNLLTCTLLEDWPVLLRTRFEQMKGEG